MDSLVASIYSSNASTTPPSSPNIHCSLRSPSPHQSPKQLPPVAMATGSSSVYRAPAMWEVGGKMVGGGVGGVMREGVGVSSKESGTDGKNGLWSVCKRERRGRVINRLHNLIRLRSKSWFQSALVFVLITVISSGITTGE